MSEFLKLHSPFEALDVLLDAMPKRKIATEVVPTCQSLGRVLANDIHSAHPLPEFRRSSMDGYAVIAHDTFGASDTQPGYLSVIGEVLMGSEPDISIRPGTCALIHTGGMLPNGANAVLILEHTQVIEKGLRSRQPEQTAKSLGFSEIEIYKSITPGENIIDIGEDIKENEIVLKAGTRIRPVEIGGCMALGIVNIEVFSKPKIAILSCGDEIISPDKNTAPGKVRDINSYTMASLVDQLGGVPCIYGIIPDDLNKMTEKASLSLTECDALLITAGSSASSRDNTAIVISSLGKPGVLVHGINVKPGKPTILAVCDGKPVLGLPGNPVSALVIGQIFLPPVLGCLTGVQVIRPKPSIFVRILINIASQTGRDDWIPVSIKQRMDDGDNKSTSLYEAEPIFSKSNLIFSLAKADGLIHVPSSAVGIPAGDIVEAFLL